MEMESFDKLHTSSYSTSVVIMAIYCIVSEIMRDIGREMQIFHSSFHLTCAITQYPFEFLS